MGAGARPVGVIKSTWTIFPRKGKVCAKKNVEDRRLEVLGLLVWVWRGRGKAIQHLSNNYLKLSFFQLL